MLMSPVLLAKESEPVGKLMFTIGKVVIINHDGKQKRVRRGAKIFEGDLIKTNKKGQAQIKFKDGARISVRPNSEFKVEAYAYDADKDKEDYKSELSLLKGGIRSITGAIGKSNKKSYKMKTVIATIGIRGTDYSLMLCNQDCNSQPGGKAGNGLYVGVVNGGVTVQNDAGSMDVSPNQYAMVGSATSIPKRLPKAPSFLMFDKTTASKTERSKVAKVFASRQSAGKKSTDANQTKESNGQQTTASNSQQTQTRQGRQTQASSRQASNSDQSAGVKDSGSSTAAVTSTSSVSNTSGSSMASLIDNRYTESSDVTVPIDVIEAIPESALTETGFTTDSVDSQVAENIEPDEENLVDDAESNVDEDTAVGVGDETVANVEDDESTAIVDETVDDTTQSTDDNATTPDQGESNTAGGVALPENPITQFFSFVFGSSSNQDNAETTFGNDNKVNEIHQVDATDTNRTSYIHYSQGTASTHDYGYDPDTGLSWGRWSLGNIDQTIGSADGVTTNSIDMTNQSLHWVTGAEGTDTVLLPITGTRNFVLIGNTNPTDNLGNVGILGSASLTADFDAQTVDAGVNLSINEQLWEGNQQNIPLNMNNGRFYTDQLDVTVTNGINTGGSMSGGLVNGTTSNGAGLNYRMDATIGGVENQVTGATAFKEVP